MKHRAAASILFTYGVGIVFLIAIVLIAATAAAPSPMVQRLANGDLLIQHSTPVGQFFRIEASTDLQSWTPLMTLRSSGMLQHTDSAAPYFPQRFYRIVQETGANILTGDHLVTDAGEIVFHPVNHASFVMSWNGKMIYSDPVGGSTAYQGLAKADLILVTHAHSDHFSSSTLTAIANPGARIIATQTIFNSMSAALKSMTTVLANGANTDVLGLNVAAVAAYNLTNSNHPLGVGNAYVLTIAGRRILISGDTEDVPEIRALANIDVAFLCMNIPFTMDVSKAASTVRQMRPKVVFPYHYRNQDNSLANLVSFQQQVGRDLGIEVRVRTWY
jgi:L-ascorbate metabolism protein UlaG (beta-lactamase superfamily)